ncbi:acyltransferase family protein [Acetobacter sp.]|jgi:fucose 4-O-acetylase-like acetyltransferase|uniref:acyltransferase family protein n=1 Tax=Acetobacter sp. TaxID=440 RepID=UPI0025C11EF4|nr:acyltransferase [Acetobacter sp.]MCH4092247.1 acyltransferase [Acetobacter sp.]MCI1299836.1 acyltransferase [Acetobacter sp.]MCI1315854.1 acyltransferase [Acetobacter sp.]
MISSPVGRDVSVDIIRGIAIILVVLGHANRGQIEARGIVPTSLQFLDFVIYAVHMPVFFLLSGYFTFISLNKRKELKFSQSRFKNIVWPYVVWSFIYCIVGHLMSSLTHVNHMVTWYQLLTIGWKPISVLWFLYALFFMQMGAVLLWRRPTIALALSLTADFAVFLVPSGILPGIVMDGVVQAPFFYIGLLLAERGLPALLPPIRKPGAWAAGFLVAYVLLAYAMFEAQAGRPVQFIMLPVALSGLLGLACLSRALMLMPSLPFIASGLARLGQASLAIYLLHILVLALVPRMLHQMHVNSVPLALICGTLFGVAGSYILYLGLEKFRIARFLVLR